MIECWWSVRHRPCRFVVMSSGILLCPVQREAAFLLRRRISNAASGSNMYGGPVRENLTTRHLTSSHLSSALCGPLDKSTRAWTLPTPATGASSMQTDTCEELLEATIYLPKRQISFHDGWQENRCLHLACVAS